MTQEIKTEQKEEIIPVTKEAIIELGWKEVEDRGMQENNGFLFYGPNNWVLRYWTAAPRLELRFKNSLAWDSSISDYPGFGPGKQLDINLLKEKMRTYAIL